MPRTNNQWTTEEVSKIIDGCRAGLSVPEITASLSGGTRRTPNGVVTQINLLQHAGIDLGSKQTRVVAVGRQIENTERRAKSSDKAFKLAMLAARREGTVNFVLGVVGTPGTECPTLQGATVSYVPTASNLV